MRHDEEENTGNWRGMPYCNFTALLAYSLIAFFIVCFFISLAKLMGK